MTYHCCKMVKLIYKWICGLFTYGSELRNWYFRTCMAYIIRTYISIIIWKGFLISTTIKRKMLIALHEVQRGKGITMSLPYVTAQIIWILYRFKKSCKPPNWYTRTPPSPVLLICIFLKFRYDGHATIEMVRRHGSSCIERRRLFILKFLRQKLQTSTLYNTMVRVERMCDLVNW